jgi:predicted ATPase
MNHAALSLAQEVADPFSLALALTYTAGVQMFRGERPAAQERAETVMTLSSEHEIAFYLVLGTILRGWAVAEQGQREEGIAQIRQGLAAYRATESELFRPYFLALLAEAYGKVGQAEEGLAALAEALVHVDKTGERYYEAELYRLRGELTLAHEGKRQNSAIPNTQHPTPSTQAVVEQEAEWCFLKAIDIAQKQQAKSLELRAATSLARLWQQQGKSAEAHDLLAPVYNWFTEGFDTKDLQEAHALLAELT